MRIKIQRETELKIKSQKVERKRSRGAKGLKEKGAASRQVLGVT